MPENSYFPVKRQKKSFSNEKDQWMVVDSNHRRRCQQIYSLSPLATRETIQTSGIIQDTFSLCKSFFIFFQAFFKKYRKHSQSSTFPAHEGSSDETFTVVKDSDKTCIKMHCLCNLCKDSAIFFSYKKMTLGPFQLFL